MNRLGQPVKNRGARAEATTQLAVQEKALLAGADLPRMPARRVQPIRPVMAVTPLV